MSALRTLGAAATVAVVGYAATRLLERHAGAPIQDVVADFAHTARDAATQREADLREALGMIDEDAQRANDPRPSASLTPDATRALLLDPAGRAPSGR